MEPVPQFSIFMMNIFSQLPKLFFIRTQKTAASPAFCKRAAEIKYY